MFANISAANSSFAKNTATLKPEKFCKSSENTLQQKQHNIIYNQSLINPIQKKV